MEDPVRAGRKARDSNCAMLAAALGGQDDNSIFEAFLCSVLGTSHRKLLDRTDVQIVHSSVFLHTGEAGRR